MISIATQNALTATLVDVTPHVLHAWEGTVPPLGILLHGETPVKSRLPFRCCRVHNGATSRRQTIASSPVASPASSAASRPRPRSAGSARAWRPAFRRRRLERAEQTTDRVEACFTTENGDAAPGRQVLEAPEHVVEPVLLRGRRLRLVGRGVRGRGAADGRGCAFGPEFTSFSFSSPWLSMTPGRAQ